MTADWLVAGGRTIQSFADNLLDLFRSYFSSQALPDVGSAPAEAAR